MRYNLSYVLSFLVSRLLHIGNETNVSDVKSPILILFIEYHDTSLVAL